MKKRLISHPNYSEPFEDRRQYMIEGDLKPLTSGWKSWTPIIVPIATIVIAAIGFIITTTIFTQTTKITTALASETADRVDIVERKDIVSDNRIANLEGYYKDILVKFDKLDIRLARIEDRLPR